MNNNVFPIAGASRPRDRSPTPDAGPANSRPAIPARHLRAIFEPRRRRPLVTIEPPVEVHPLEAAVMVSVALFIGVLLATGGVL